jgi:uncharacterized protein (DUF2235 family)
MALYAFDGTWNEEKDTGIYGVNTNVVEFARAYRGRLAAVQQAGEEGGPTVRDDFYVSGPGTRRGVFGKWFGGAFGFGGRTRIKEAKAAVARNFREGDEAIDIVGFSRGAALALHFANMLGGETFQTAEGRKVKPEVRFLGLWDVVAAFGIPLDLGPLNFQRINIGYKLKLPDHVKYCFHAVALDERRKAFRVTRVDNGYQVWFRGVHSDVGGGNQNSALSNLALAWMLRKAQRVGLPIDATIADTLQVDTGAAVRAGTGGPVGKFREMSSKDRIHFSVSPRHVRECQDPPAGCPVESKDDERSRVLTTADLKAAAG